MVAEWLSRPGGKMVFWKDRVISSNPDQSKSVSLDILLLVVVQCICICSCYSLNITIFDLSK